MHIETLTYTEWDSALPSSGFEWAHAPETLRVLENHVTGDLRLYAGYNGEELIGLLPAVVRTELFATAVLSPPPGYGIPQLGPILMPASPKQRRQEIVNREFTAALLETVSSLAPLTLVGLSCSTGYTDPRPYRWDGFDVETLFTYQLPLEDTSSECVLRSFSRDARREIRDAQDAGFTVGLQGLEGARKVYDSYKARRNEQGDNYPVSWEYIRDLVAALEERVRVYVAETPDGEFVSGVIVVFSNEKAYFLQGGTRVDHLNVSSNALLHWRVFEDILTDPALSSIDRCDLGNANIEPLAHYKSKYGAKPVPHYLLKSSLLMDLAQKAYELIVY